jgi:hypothetical protein
VWRPPERRPGRPPQQESARSRVRGCSACPWPSAFLAPSLDGSHCTAAGLLRQGQALRCAPAGGAWDWRVGGPLTRWPPSGLPPPASTGCAAHTSRTATAVRSGSQREQEGGPGGPRCWRTSVAGTARAGGQAAHARAGRGAGVGWRAVWGHRAPSWVSARRGPHPVSSRSPFSTGLAPFKASGAALSDLT